MTPWGPWGDGFGLFAILIFLANIVFWVGLIVLIVLGIRWLLRNTARDGGESARPAGDDALEVLRQRFARGEIDAAEYEERKRTLGG